MLVEKAQQLAYRLHKEQLDKAAQPYIFHLQFVASLVSQESDDVIATAWLHDCVEDTEMTVEQIRILFGDIIADAVNAITKREGESYLDYLSRVKQNEIARKVKIADLIHNMDLNRLLRVTEKDLARQNKYKQATKFLRT